MHDAALVPSILSTPPSLRTLSGVRRRLVLPVAFTIVDKVHGRGRRRRPSSPGLHAEHRGRCAPSCRCRNRGIPPLRVDAGPAMAVAVHVAEDEPLAPVQAGARLRRRTSLSLRDWPRSEPRPAWRPPTRLDRFDRLTDREEGISDAARRAGRQRGFRMARSLRRPGARFATFFRSCRLGDRHSWD